MTACAGGMVVKSGAGGGGHNQPVRLIGWNVTLAAVTAFAMGISLSQMTLCPRCFKACAVLRNPPQSKCPCSGAEINQNFAMMLDSIRLINFDNDHNLFLSLFLLTVCAKSYNL
jgi:hypothetical protein